MTIIKYFLTWILIPWKNFTFWYSSRIFRFFEKKIWSINKNFGIRFENNHLFVFLAFANQAQLKELYLNNNNIRSINRKMLLKMQKLEVLDLSYNKIGYVDPDAGTCLKELTTSRATSSGPRLCPCPVRTALIEVLTTAKTTVL